MILDAVITWKMEGKEGKGRKGRKGKKPVVKRA